MSGSSGGLGSLRRVAGFLDLHLDDRHRVGADDFRGVGSAWRDSTTLPRLCTAGTVVLPLETNSCLPGVQVDHHAIDLVLVRRGLDVRLVHHLQDAHLVVIDQGLGAGGDSDGKQENM